jgi:hypothetical protein
MRVAVVTSVGTAVVVTLGPADMAAVAAAAKFSQGYLNLVRAASDARKPRSGAADQLLPIRRIRRTSVLDDGC